MLNAWPRLDVHNRTRGQRKRRSQGGLLCTPPRHTTPLNPSTDYNLFIDANNAPDWTLDRRGNSTSQPDYCRGLAALQLILDAYSLADNFRYIHPVAREYTHIHHGLGGTTFAKTPRPNLLIPRTTPSK